MECPRVVDTPGMDPQLTGLSPSLQEAVPPQSDVDDFLRKKRKAREHKACYPCRQRKVKCDLSRPCHTCRDREHPELCSYHPPNKRHNAEQEPTVKFEDISSGTGPVVLGRGEFDLLCHKLSCLENSIAELKQALVCRPEGKNSDVEASRSSYHGVGSIEADEHSPTEEHRHRPTHTDVHGLHTKNDQGEVVHLGGGSIPAMLYRFSQRTTDSNADGDQSSKQTTTDPATMQEFLGASVLPLFGLDNESATYPFVDLWGLPHASLQRAQELARALPNDEQILDLFRNYRDLGHVSYPGVADVPRLEQHLNEFLRNRTAQVGTSEGVTERTIYGKTYYWLGMLFAVLASGAQCSKMPRRQRELTSQVYVCCGFECLRFTNFFSQAHLETIQALLVMGNVMANNMNAGAAWALLGLTIRLAQGMGLHRACPPHISPQHVFPRARVWWAIIWQDSLLSITYDRASSTAVIDMNTMPMPQHYGHVGHYHSIMYRLCRVGLNIVRDRSILTDPRELSSQIMDCQEAISNIMREAAEYLRDSRKCTSTRESLEHWGLYLHTSYVLSELYRPAISQNHTDVELATAFRHLCIENLANTVEAYLGANNISSFAKQSWAGVHRALSSAILLGILGEHTRNERARRLIARFSSIMVDLTDDPDRQEISAPVHRGIAALRKLNLQEASRPQSHEPTYRVSKHAALADDEGSQKQASSAIITPANTDSEDDHSPYSVLNSILWGISPDHMQPGNYLAQ